MNKRTISLFALTIMIVASLSGLFILQDDVRSDIKASTPYSMSDSETDGFIIVNGEMNRHLLIDSIYHVYATIDGKSNCNLSISFSDSSFGPYNHLRYDYQTMDNIPVPEGSVMEYISGSESRYAYTDPLTNTDLTFHINGHIPIRIDFEGSTIRERDGQLEHLSFEIHVDYENDLRYVNDIIIGDVPDELRLDITGTENGIKKDGTITVQPLSSTVYEGQESVFTMISIDIAETRIPDRLTSFYKSLQNGYSFSEQDSMMQYLTADGTYVNQTVTCKFFQGNDGYELILEGTITSSKLDSVCNILSTETLTFHYEVA